MKHECYVSWSNFYFQLVGGAGKLGICGGLGTFGGGKGGLFCSFCLGTGGGGIFDDDGGIVGNFGGGNGGRFDGRPPPLLDAILAFDLYRSSLRLNPS